MRQPGGRGALISTLASLAGLLAALSCCLPLGTLLMAAGSAGASLAFETLRPWMLPCSAGLLVFAFVQTYFGRRCEFCHRRLRTVLLWFSAAAVLAMVAAPGVVGSLLAGRLPSFQPASELRDFDPAGFAREFDADSARTRVVVLLSPT